jgi:hypothetical protein
MTPVRTASMPHTHQLVIALLLALLLLLAPHAARGQQQQQQTAAAASLSVAATFPCAQPGSFFDISSLQCIACDQV